MRSADALHTRPQAPATRPGRKATALLSLCLVCAAAVLTYAQSGRAPSAPAPPTPQAAGSRPRQVNQSARELPSAFIVATAPPDGSQETSPYTPQYTPNTEFEEIARGGCLAALRGFDGVKKVIGDVGLARWEARETALGEDESWVIWLELKWTQTITSDAPPFRLRYLLFEPRTGRVVASGYGRGVRQTWGQPRPRVSVEDQLREAGRDIAEQVASELKNLP
jgi:hypothetical protein